MPFFFVANALRALRCIRGTPGYRGEVPRGGAGPTKFRTVTSTPASFSHWSSGTVLPNKKKMLSLLYLDDEDSTSHIHGYYMYGYMLEAAGVDTRRDRVV
jgi:hypothetical protein